MPPIQDRELKTAPAHSQRAQLSARIVAHRHVGKKIGVFFGNVFNLIDQVACVFSDLFFIVLDLFSRTSSCSSSYLATNGALCASRASWRAERVIHRVRTSHLGKGKANYNIELTSGLLIPGVPHRCLTAADRKAKAALRRKQPRRGSKQHSPPSEIADYVSANCFYRKHRALRGGHPSRGACARSRDTRVKRRDSHSCVGLSGSAPCSVARSEHLQVHRIRRQHQVLVWRYDPPERKPRAFGQCETGSREHSSSMRSAQVAQNCRLVG